MDKEGHNGRFSVFLQLPVWRYLVLLFLSGWLAMSALAGFSDRRQIIVFATPGSEPGGLIQRSVDTLRCQLTDRDTDVRFVDLTELRGAGATVSKEKLDEQGTLAELESLRGEGRPDFEVVLVGKDGGVKARTSDPNALEDFLALIDTMPMRRAEVRSRGQDDSACD